MPTEEYYIKQFQGQLEAIRRELEGIRFAVLAVAVQEQHNNPGYGGVSELIELARQTEPGRR